MESESPSLSMASPLNIHTTPPASPHTTPPSSLINRLRTGSKPSPLSYLDNAEALEVFKDLKLETHDWYWNLGFLVFGMAILIAGDILYDFPSGPLTIFSWGTGRFTTDGAAIHLEYVIWFGLIILILFTYTAICVTLDWHVCYLRCQYISGQHNQVQDIIIKIARYAVVVILLAGTMAFDALLFYAPDAFEKAYGQAIQSHAMPSG
jgi:hypothetical protein